MAHSRRILITGGAGFVGVHLARCLSSDPGSSVTLVDNFARGQFDAALAALAKRPNVQLHTGDLTEVATYLQLGQGYDEVYHLAAMLGVENVVRQPQAVLRVNALTTLYLLDWFVQGGGAKLLFASTSEVYAWTQQVQPLPIPTPETVPLTLTDIANPRSSYAGSKIFGELLVHHYGTQFDKPFVIVRYHNVYGPRMGYDHAIPQLFERLRQRPPTLTVYAPDHQRAFCYIDDAVRATRDAMRSSAANGQVINVGNDSEEVSIAQLADLLIALVGAPVTIVPARAANDPIKRRCPDITRARTLLGFAPTVSLRDGLATTLAWYAAQPPRNDQHD